MRVYYDPDDVIDLNDYGISVPITRSNAQETVRRLMEDPLLAQTSDRWLRCPRLPGPDEQALTRVHDPEMVRELLGDGPALARRFIDCFELIDKSGSYHRYDPTKARLSWSELRDALIGRGGGSYEAALDALSQPAEGTTAPAAWYFGGGFHHAHRDRGIGFCMFNDVVTTLSTLLHEKRIASAVIVDVDVHKGDGTASLCASEPRISTMSVHMARGWPLDQLPSQSIGDLARHPDSFTPSDVDVPIGVGEEELYTPLMVQGLERLLGHHTTCGPGGPDIAVILAGADPFEEDRLPSSQYIQMTRSQMAERDRRLYEFFSDRAIPMVYVTAGNYGFAGWKIYYDFLQWVLGDLGHIPR